MKNSATKPQWPLYKGMQIRSLVGLFAGLAGCAAEPQPEVATIERCGSRICAANSPTVGHYGFWELNVRGVPNDQGVELLGLSLGRDFFDPVVIGSQLRARDAKGNELTGPQLIGAVLWIRQGTDQYGIVISNMGVIDEVVSPPQSPPGKLETYVLDWSAVIANPLSKPVAAGEFPKTGEMPVLAGTATNVCPPPVWNTSGGGEVEFDPTARMDVYHSLLFEGDRFSLDWRQVKPAPEDDWFNIGCGAHTLAKLRLTRNTMHTTVGDWRNVQAAFKMLSADYCGTGYTFTVDGEPLVWRDRGYMPFWQQPRELEARWDENGAVCLNAPRLLQSSNPLAGKIFSWKRLRYECASRKLPPCAELDPNQWEGKELVVSGNFD